MRAGLSMPELRIALGNTTREGLTATRPQARPQNPGCGWVIAWRGGCQPGASAHCHHSPQYHGTQTV